jgi:hypothetical protein
MAQWGSNDASSNSVLWSGALVKLAPNSANRDAIYGNTTADAFITGTTKGVFGVGAAEVTADAGKVAHSGWVMRTVGSGGRAGRVMTEVLVAGGIAGDGSDDAAFPDYTLRFTTQPSNITANATSNQTNSVSVVVASAPVGATVSYLWQTSTDSGATWANSTGTGYVNPTNSTMIVWANSISTGTRLRVIASATGAANITSSAVTFTVTS